MDESGEARAAASYADGLSRQFGAGVATLVWLYMVAFSILLGAEFNAQIFPVVPRPHLTPDEKPVTMSS